MKLKSATLDKDALIEEDLFLRGVKAFNERDFFEAHELWEELWSEYNLSERIFVLKPWNDIAPNFVVPGQNAMVSEILENTDDDSDVRMVLIFDKEGMI